MRRIWIFVLALLLLIQAVSVFTAHAQEDTITTLSQNAEGHTPLR